MVFVQGIQIQANVEKLSFLAYKDAVDFKLAKEKAVNHGISTR
jgi:hypothetical protein